MKKIFTLALLIAFGALSAQLYVSPNATSYVYVTNQYLFVKQDVNLGSTSSLYLREGAQLIQGVSGVSTNKGEGTLSVLQEGNVDNYEYNYWCSPVGKASPLTTGNENFGITQLNRPTSLTASTPAVMMSTASLDGVASPLQIAPRWVFKFLSSINYSQWVSVGSATNIAAGEGFTMKGTSGTDIAGTFTDGGVKNNPLSAQRYDFRGKPNDGDITINVAAGKMTLTGNPYPSAIDLQAFLLGASNSTGVAYFWEQDKNVNSHNITAYQGGYGTYAAGTNLYTKPMFNTYDGSGSFATSTGSQGAAYMRQFSPIGQGFMIEGLNTGTVTMTNSRRIVFKKEGIDTQFARQSGNHNAGNFLPEIPSVSGFDYTQVSTLPTPHIRLNVLVNDHAVRELALAFSPLATDGVDRAYDAKSPSGASDDSFFPLEGKEYVMSAIDYDINKKVPLAFKGSAARTFKVTVAETVNFSDAEHIYMHDKQNGTYHDIKNGIFEVTLPAGTEASRFEITFVESALGVPQIKDSAFDIIQNNTEQELTISNPDLISVKSCSVYDMSGKLILSKTNLGTEPEYSFSTHGLSDGIYIVKLLTSKSQDFGRKVSIFNEKN
jgi:hypothetical protein